MPPEFCIRCISDASKRNACRSAAKLAWRQLRAAAAAGLLHCAQQDFCTVRSAGHRMASRCNLSCVNYKSSCSSLCAMHHQVATIWQAYLRAAYSADCTAVVCVCPPWLVNAAWQAVLQATFDGCKLQQRPPTSRGLHHNGCGCCAAGLASSSTGRNVRAGGPKFWKF
jgi:hypothetical protein